MLCENAQQKTDILISVYENIHKHIRKNEALENKVCFSVSATFMLFAAFLLKEHILLNSFWKSLLGTMIILMAISALHFLYKIHERIKTQCRMIVNIEKTFGLYEPLWFTKHLDYKDRKNIPNQVFEDDLSSWGNKNRRLLVIPHAFGIVFAAFAAVSSLFIDPSYFEKDENGKRGLRDSKSVVAPTGFQPQKYLDITPRPLGQ